MTERERERAERATYPPPGSNDPHEERHGETAEDRGGVGEGEEGYVAEEYPGHLRLREESDAAYDRRRGAASGAPHRASAAGDAPFEPLAPDERERIHGELCERLAHLELSCRDLRFELRGRTVVLEGEVPDLHVKQEIEGVCSTIAGVERVENRLTVAPRAR